MLKTILSRAALAAAALSLSFAPAGAQIRTVDPNTVVDADLDDPEAIEGPQSTPQAGVSAQEDVYYDTAPVTPAEEQAQSAPAATVQTAPQNPAPAGAPAATAAKTTYKKDDLIGAAEGIFGKGAQGLAGLIEDILKKQGEPNGYIVGREAGGALVLGVRYGSGTLHHKIEGELPAYWTGPSIGFDVGGNASNTFVLVYNLYDTQDLYHRFPAAEGTAYLVGGFTASYLRWGSVVLIPIRLGVGYRLGINAGYMKFTEKRNWLPF